MEWGDTVDSPWMTTKEAMEYLRVSRSTLYRLVRNGKVTRYALDGTDEGRFKREELDLLLTPTKENTAEGRGR